MTATLPLHRWRIIGSLGLSHHRLGGRRQPVHGDCPWLWTTIKANPTARAVLASVAHGMYTIAAQLRCQEQAFGRAGLHAQPASLTFLDTDHHLSPRSPFHIYSSRCVCRLRMLQPFRPFAVFVKLVTVLRMSDSNQRLRPLPDGLPVQVRHAVLRDNEPDKPP